MRSKSSALKTAWALVALANLTGCGYVHFGRFDQPLSSAHPELVAENTDLKLERKILQQELALARREGDSLRSALESRKSGSDTEIADRLRETTRELATLRADYARLQSARNAAGSDSSINQTVLEQVADLRTQLGTAERELAQASRKQAEAQQENTRLRLELDGIRRENLDLTAQVQSLTLQNEQAAAALAQLNTELLAQKTGRQAAEDRARAAQTQLQMVVTKARDNSAAPALTLADARQTTTGSASEAEATLQLAAGADANSTAILRTSPERLQQATAAPGPMRQHTVVEGDTLEKIAIKFYGRSDQWRKIYAANNVLLRGGRPLKPGMMLDIPE